MIGISKGDTKVLQGRVDVNMGSILENHIVQNRKKIVPIEIKSGNDYKKHSSLTQALQTAN